jgi:hypothetical protein
MAQPGRRVLQVSFEERLEAARSLIALDCRQNLTQAADTLRRITTANTFGLRHLTPVLVVDEVEPRI